MKPAIRDAVAIMNRLAPPDTAEEWDNVGLQIGHSDWPVETVWVSLDPSPQVVAAACQADVDLLITHHPLLFRPLKTIDFNTSLGDIIYRATTHRLSIFCAHTNLDSASGGINDHLAKQIGITNPKSLVTLPPDQYYKLVIFSPIDAEDDVLRALHQAGAGQIGNYSCCSFIQAGTGTFMPDAGTHPYLGEKGELNRVPEVKIEAIVPESSLAAVIENVRRHHPYETMAYDVYPLRGEKREEGLGRIGALAEAVTLDELARDIQRKLGLASIRVVGAADLTAAKVAVCSGSGGSLVPRFLSTDADVFVSGDFRYHEARTIEEAGRGLIDIGHFSSEHLIVPLLAERLQTAFSERELPVTVTPCMIETDPFQVLSTGPD